MKDLCCGMIWESKGLPGSVAVHLTCTTRQKVAQLCAEKVVVPEGVGCCGFAGDKGMTNPELNSYALRKLRDQIGLQHNSGIPYVSIIYLVNSCTVAVKDGKTS